MTSGSRINAAFITIILVWSTTPLAISWSNIGLAPSAAVGLRMLMAGVLGLLLLRLMRVAIPLHAQALRTYGYSILGIFGAMTCVYHAALYVPSGWISVLFALAPLTSNVFAARLLGRVDFSLSQWCAFLLSLSGLVVICLDDLVVQADGWIGILLLLIAVTLYGLSGVLVQREQLAAHPLATTVGGLWVSLPFFALSWWLSGASMPVLDFTGPAPWAIVYLATFGSLLGFACYFLVVRERGASAVAMVTLMTPVLALYLGTTFNNEPLTKQIIVGSALVIAGLAVHYRMGSFLTRVLRRQSEA